MEEVGKEIVNEIFFLSHKDTKTNISIPFYLDKEATKIRVFYSYSPKFGEGEIAKEMVLKGLEKYADNFSEKDRDVEAHLPIENFVSLSLFKNDEYLGSFHNKARRQEVIITKDLASSGFWPTDISSGLWELQLNCHCIASEQITVKVRIEVE